ncbi:hypothetical protein G9A89_008017 [Geosiphon pyriformis]|nr:hypothetical protein G9A89_008017 [Geosiphon pyriformis]
MFQISKKRVKYNKSKPFILDYEVTVGCSIVVIKKAVKVSGLDNGFKPVFLRKKRRDGILEDGSGGKSVGLKVQISYLWSLETGDTTESDSIDMKKECLMKETSFDYGEDGVLAKEDPNQTPTNSKVNTKRALDKPLGKINFLSSNVDDDVFSDALLELPPPFKNLVNISVHKFFTLDIGLDKVVGKFFQEKLQVVKRLFSKINGFGGVSTLSKFAGIIKASFTSESSLAQASKKTEEVKILVNTNVTHRI